MKPAKETGGQSESAGLSTGQAAEIYGLTEEGAPAASRPAIYLSERGGRLYFLSAAGLGFTLLAKKGDNLNIVFNESRTRYEFPAKLHSLDRNTSPEYDRLIYPLYNKKTENYVICVLPDGEPRKIQRRESYRIKAKAPVLMSGCGFKKLSAAEMTSEGGKMTTLDLSATGMRFKSFRDFAPGEVLELDMLLEGTAIHTTVEVLGSRVIKSGDDFMYELRVKYLNMDEALRDVIVKYIFEEERKRLKLRRILEDI